MEYIVGKPNGNFLPHKGPLKRCFLNVGNQPIIFEKLS